MTHPYEGVWQLRFALLNPFCGRTIRIVTYVYVDEHGIVDGVPLGGLFDCWAGEPFSGLCVQLRENTHSPFVFQRKRIEKCPIVLQ